MEISFVRYPKWSSNENFICRIPVNYITFLRTLALRGPLTAAGVCRESKLHYSQAYKVAKVLKKLEYVTILSQRRFPKNPAITETTYALTSEGLIVVLGSYIREKRAENEAVSRGFKKLADSLELALQGIVLYKTGNIKRARKKREELGKIGNPEDWFKNEPRPDLKVSINEALHETSIKWRALLPELFDLWEKFERNHVGNSDLVLAGIVYAAAVCTTFVERDAGILHYQLKPQEEAKLLEYRGPRPKWSWGEGIVNLFLLIVLEELVQQVSKADPIQPDSIDHDIKTTLRIMAGDPRFYSQMKAIIRAEQYGWIQAAKIIGELKADAKDISF